MRLLNMAQAAAYAGYSRSTIQFHRDFGTLAVMGGRISEDELKRWIAERIEVRAAKVLAREERKRLKAERYEEWLASQGLQRATA